MTVLNGLSNLYVAGYDLSGDVGSIGSIKGGPALLDVSTIDLAGMKRIAGRFDGEVGYNVYFDPLGAHVYLSAFPTADAPIMIPVPPTLNSDVFMLIAKTVKYEPAIGAGLEASFSVQALASMGFPLEVGLLATNGKRTDTGATASGTGIDLGIPTGVAAVAITSSSVASPTHIITAAPHGLLTGDSVLIAGHSGSTPSINDAYTVTRISDTEFTIVVNVTVGGTGGTVQRSSHRGWAAQNQVFSITGTSVAAKLQDAPKNLSGSFADLVGGGFAAVTSGAARGAERIASASGIIQRFVRVASVGTFNPATFATGVWTKEG